jgi:hypothetical protein
MKWFPIYTSRDRETRKPGKPEYLIILMTLTCRAMSSPFLRALLYILLVLGSLLINAFSLAPASAQGHVDIEFENEGRNIEKLSLDQLAAITPAVLLKVFEIHENRERIYRALPARPVFDKVFGKDWRKAQEIVFTSIDGYQPSVAGSEVPRTRRLPRLRT